MKQVFGILKSESREYLGQKRVSEEQDLGSQGQMYSQQKRQNIGGVEQSYQGPSEGFQAELEKFKSMYQTPSNAYVSKRPGNYSKTDALSTLYQSQLQTQLQQPNNYQIQSQIPQVQQPYNHINAYKVKESSRWEDPVHLTNIKQFIDYYSSVKCYTEKQAKELYKSLQRLQDRGDDSQSKDQQMNTHQKTIPNSQFLTASNARAPGLLVSAASAQTNVKCSTDLSLYIDRSFTKCNNKIEREIMTKYLKKVFNTAQEHEILFTKDWSNTPLPILPRENLTQNGQSSGGFSITPDDLVTQIRQQGIQKRQPLLAAAGIQNNQFQLKANIQGQRIPQNFQQLPSPAKSEKKPNLSDAFLTKEERSRRRDREERFQREQLDAASSGPKYQENQVLPQHLRDELDLDSLTQLLTVKGTNMNLEKPYFRLTAAPDPTTVRPENVLKKSLKLMKKKWKKSEAQYRYIDEQMRSIRQDLTVQRIKNELTVNVYQTHARIALEVGDLNQFNQCQTQLHYLFQQGIEGSQMEFLAYRILYLVLNDLKYDMAKLYSELTTEKKKHRYIKHALRVRQAVSQGDYRSLFNLYQLAPNLGQFLMNIFVDMHRIIALKKISLAYVLGINLDYLANILAFDSTDLLKDFLKTNGAVISSCGTKLDCKLTVPVMMKCHPGPKVFDMNS